MRGEKCDSGVGYQRNINADHGHGDPKRAMVMAPVTTRCADAAEAKAVGATNRTTSRLT